MPAKYKLIYLSPAVQDLEEILQYHILNVGPASVRKISAQIESEINQLTLFPMSGQQHPDPLLSSKGFRKLLLTKTYVAIYKVIGNTVYIYRIVNGKTDYVRLLR